MNLSYNPIAALDEIIRAEEHLPWPEIELLKMGGLSAATSRVDDNGGVVGRTLD